MDGVRVRQKPVADTAHGVEGAEGIVKLATHVAQPLRHFFQFLRGQARFDQLDVYPADQRVRDELGHFGRGGYAPHLRPLGQEPIHVLIPFHPRRGHRTQPADHLYDAPQLVRDVHAEDRFVMGHPVPEFPDLVQIVM